MTLRRNQPHARSRWAALMVMVIAATLIAPVAALAADGPYTVDGVLVPDTGTTVLPDPEGNVKELGPLNSNTTKIGVIHSDALPTLGLTNPNGQVDLRQAWLDTERDTNGDIWLYFAWERDANSGSGFIAYEFMKNAAPAGCAYDSATDAQLIADCNPWANRSAGDFIILWDQQGGSRDLYLRTWTGTAPNLTLGAPTLLNATVSQAAYSADGFKGEAAVNLSATIFSGVTGCLSFANTIPSTVTGNSDQADYKDTILQTAPPITNCGSVKIVKTDDATPANPLNGAEFTLYHNNAPLAAPRGAEDVITDPVQKCTTSGTGTTAGTCTILDVIPGTYWVVETVVPTNYAAAPDTAITVVTDTLTTVTLVDPLQLGSIRVEKTAKHFGPGSANLAATFTVKQGTTTFGTVTTNGTTGIGCIANVPFGSYTVEETTGPAGYLKDSDVETVSVQSSASCPTGSDTASFENMPLTDITVSVNSQVAGGTASDISCTGISPTPADTTTGFNDTSETYKNLVEGTYTCTIVIDP